MCSWRVPPNWSPAGWHEEVMAHGAAAAWQAAHEFDAHRGVPLAAFVYHRIMARSLARYRKEWSYALHCIPEHVPSPDEESADNPAFCSNGNGAAGAAGPSSPSPEFVYETLRHALSRLSSADQQLIQRIFWGEATETQLGHELGISHQAVNKRKRAILCDLRRELTQHGEQADDFSI